ncbi:MAG: 3-oxoacyl-[acyl-carrier-protein] synthase III C-terminal domain-containing protein [Acidimicrobiia bacterium]
MTAVITGTGVAVPPIVVTNDDLGRIMDTSDEWIRSRSGVVQRRFVEPGTGASDLAVEAAQAALADAGVDPSSVDVLVTATMTPDVINPGIAPLVQKKLGLGPIPAFDLRQQCSGFLYGLDLADSMIASDRADTVVVVGAEVHAGYLPWGDAWEIVLGQSDRAPTPEEWELASAHRGWSVLFGDGAGAMVVQRSDAPDTGVLSSVLHTDGRHFELIVGGDFGSLNRPYVSEAMLAEGLHIPRMDGGGLYRQAVRLMPEAITDVLEKSAYSVDDLDVVVAHQANDRILAGVRRQLGVDEELVPSNIALWGNTTAGTLPILFHELRQAGRVESGALVCFTAFGAGAHWGAILYRQP